MLASRRLSFRIFAFARSRLRRAALSASALCFLTHPRPCLRFHPFAVAFFRSLALRSRFAPSHAFFSSSQAWGFLPSRGFSALSRVSSEFSHRSRVFRHSFSCLEIQSSRAPPILVGGGSHSVPSRTARVAQRRARYTPSRVRGVRTGGLRGPRLAPPSLSRRAHCRPLSST